MDQGSGVVDRSTGRIPHKKSYFERKVQKLDHFAGMYLFFDRLRISREKPPGVGFFSVFLTEASRF